MKIGTDTPTDEGLYAVEIYYGWKLLQWSVGEWWFEQKTAKWMAGAPVQWVGPLPGRVKRNFQPLPKEIPQEFDL